MEKPKVYFYKDTSNLKAGINKFFQMITEEEKYDPDEQIGIKIHFGERENDTHVDPELLKGLPKIFQKPIFVECNVLYRGNRTNKSDHLQQAAEHGFDFIEIEILDGEIGGDFMEIEIDTKNTKLAKLGKELRKFHQLISIAHFKGHIATGFGGAFKNIGMGLGSRGGKLDMHAGISPKIQEEKCIACGACAEQCPGDAITVENVAEIDQSLCIGCAQCIAICPEGAVGIPWGSHSNEVLMEKIAEYTLAALKNRNWWYINFLTDITLKCDCVGTKQEPIMEDIGILFSKDPVAIDQASLDLVIEYNAGIDPFKKANNVNSEHLLEYAEKIDMGSREYELERIE
ncbi:MAG: DUF362 domain-containing protein [Candidatus Heimdallarchaeota archaeon]|nr:DUF362 domain-containing protein [Candidatus Heimdallarchaeota archaeon]